MSMQMTKRVSLSQPWGLNRAPNQIEPLGSLLYLHGVTGRIGRVDRMQDPIVRSTDLRHVFLPLIHRHMIPTVRFTHASTQVMIGCIGDKTGRAGASPAPLHTHAITQRPDMLLKGPNMARGGMNSLFKNLQIN